MLTVISVLVVMISIMIMVIARATVISVAINSIRSMRLRISGTAHPCGPHRFHRFGRDHSMFWFTHWRISDQSRGTTYLR